MYYKASTFGVKKYVLVFFMIAILSSCGDNYSTEAPTNTQTDNTTVVATQEQQEPILVSASIVPISSIVNTVGGDFVEVENIVPAGVSPHGFDLSAQKMAQISKSETVFMIGLEHIDGFLSKAITDEKQVRLADGMELIEVQGHEHHDEHEDDHHEDEDENHDEDKHDDHSSDPHVWLGKNNIIKIVKQVRDELTKILPEQEQYFSDNTTVFIEELERIYSDFDTQVAEKTAQEFIVFHDAYNYLMQSVDIDLNLKVAFSENILHDTTAAHLAELVDEIQLHGITYAFTEPQFESGNLQKFANEYNLTIGTLDPLGTNPGASGYLDNLKSNLENLAKIYE